MESERLRRKQTSDPIEREPPRPTNSSRYFVCFVYNNQLSLRTTVAFSIFVRTKVSSRWSSSLTHENVSFLSNPRPLALLAYYSNTTISPFLFFSFRLTCAKQRPLFVYKLSVINWQWIFSHFLKTNSVFIITKCFDRRIHF